MKRPGTVEALKSAAQQVVDDYYGGRLFHVDHRDQRMTALRDALRALSESGGGREERDPEHDNRCEREPTCPWCLCARRATAAATDHPAPTPPSDPRLKSTPVEGMSEPRANLGLATTRELLAEITTRIEVGACCLNYSTVTGETHTCEARTLSESGGGREESDDPADGEFCSCGHRKDDHAGREMDGRCIFKDGADCGCKCFVGIGLCAATDHPTPTRPAWTEDTKRLIESLAVQSCKCNRLLGSAEVCHSCRARSILDAAAGAGKK